MYEVTTLIINNPVLVQDIVFRHVDPVQQQYQKLLWRCSLIASARHPIPPPLPIPVIGTLQAVVSPGRTLRYEGRETGFSP